MIVIDNDDFKIPKSCGRCSLCYDCMYCSISGTKTDYENMHDKRLDDCPLKEVETD